MAVELVSSCADPPEMLEYQRDTEQLKAVVRDSREDVQRVDDELRTLSKEKRTWEDDKTLDALSAEVDKLRAARDAAKTEWSTEDEKFEDMKQARLP